MSHKLNINFEQNFTVLPNQIWMDKRLSAKAKGLWCTIISLHEQWNFTVAGLASLCSDGVASVKSGIEELEEFGWLSWRRVRDSSNRWDVVVDVFIPDVNAVVEIVENEATKISNDFLNENPIKENPINENSISENPIWKNQSNKEYIYKELNNKEFNNKLFSELESSQQEKVSKKKKVEKVVKKSRSWDERTRVKNFLASLQSNNLDEMTSNEWGRIDKALKLLDEVTMDLTDNELIAEVEKRKKVYKNNNENVQFTVLGLVGQWSTSKPKASVKKDVAVFQKEKVPLEVKQKGLDNIRKAMFKNGGSDE